MSNEGWNNATQKKVSDQFVGQYVKREQDRRVKMEKQQKVMLNN